MAEPTPRPPRCPLALSIGRGGASLTPPGQPNGPLPSLLFSRASEWAGPMKGGGAGLGALWEQGPHPGQGALGGST